MKNKIFETHMHIYEDTYNNTRNEVIAESLDVGICKMIAVGYDKHSSQKALDMAHEYPFIYAAVGVHPSEVQKEVDKNLTWIYELAKDEKVIAIGEIGLDYYWDKTYVDLQKKFFVKQMEIANKLDLPIIIHCRDAINDCYNILEEHNSKGVMHCFSGSVEMAEKFINLGYYLGVGGVVTFKNAKEIKKVVNEVTLDRLLTETDSPYLTPEPHRGEINKPSYIPLIIKQITEIKQMDQEIIQESLYRNACRLFKIKE